MVEVMVGWGGRGLSRGAACWKGVALEVSNNTSTAKGSRDTCDCDHGDI